MKTNLTKRLSSYSGLASSILIYASYQSDAQIVYVNPPDILVNTPGITLDLDNNGLIDFEFNYNNPNGNSPGAFIDLYTNGSVLTLGDNPCGLNYSNRPVGIPAGKVIKKDLDHWYGINDFGAPFCFGYPYLGCNMWWHGKTEMIGVRFPVDADHFYIRRYGWIRLSVANDCNSITIHDWAYNSQPNHPIKAGQTMRLASDEIDAEGILIYSFQNQIHLENNFGNDDLNLKVYNSLGQLVRAERTTNENLTIDMSDCLSGIYMVETIGLSYSFTQQVFID